MLEQLANEIIEHAKVGGMTVATAESCSAGRLAQALAKAEGASKHYLGGVVAYTKEMKERMLGVPPQLLQEGLRPGCGGHGYRRFIAVTGHRRRIDHRRGRS